MDDGCVGPATTVDADEGPSGTKGATTRVRDSPPPSRPAGGEDNILSVCRTPLDSQEILGQRGGGERAPWARWRRLYPSFGTTRSAKSRIDASTRSCGIWPPAFIHTESVE